MSYEYDNSEELDVTEIRALEEAEWDKEYDRMQQERDQFVADSPEGIFELIDVMTFQDLIEGEYHSQKNYYNQTKEPELVLPDLTQYYPKKKTEQEIIEEKKGWVYFGYETDEDNSESESKILKRRRRKRRKMVIKPLYPELHKIKIKTPPPPPPKTKEEAVAEQKKANVKKTGNAWGKTPTTPTISMDEAQKLALEAMRKQKEEEEQKKREEQARKKYEEEMRLRREEEKRKQEERRRYFREQRQRKEDKRRNRVVLKNGGSKKGGRFSRDNLGW